MTQPTVSTVLIICPLTSSVTELYPCIPETGEKMPHKVLFLIKLSEQINSDNVTWSAKNGKQHIILLFGGTVFVMSFMSTADDNAMFVSSAGWPDNPEGPGSSASCVNGWSSVVGETI